MGKIVCEYETEYEVGDVIVFNIHDKLHVGIIEGYYVDHDTFWFNVRINKEFVYSYSNYGDISESDIIGKLEGDLKEKCEKFIKESDRL